MLVLLTPCFSQYQTGPLVAISLVKDCLFSFSGQSETNNVLALQCLPKKPCETLRLGNVYEHAQPQETSRGKCSLSLSTPPASPFPPQLLTGSEFGTRELEKGQRWVREKHRWLSDGLALSDPDSPTQSLHLKGHFHETSKISVFQQFEPLARKMVQWKLNLSYS